MHHKPKILTYYLPQFHEIPENNKWWGKGFTEWTNLSKARNLFRSHQILRPLDGIEYNLLDKSTVLNQINLAKNSNIDGFNYYHYWYKGKKILHKPAENFLNWKDLDHEFMFMWANHSWSKSWVGKSSEILLSQEYGDKNDWIEHINYLLQFFKDDRYIKIDNKPAFEIYLPFEIPNYEEMIDTWNEILKKNGFNGIYLIEHFDYHNYLNSIPSDRCSSITYNQHGCALGIFQDSQKDSISFIFTKALEKFNQLILGKPRIYDYVSLTKIINKFNKTLDTHSKDVIFQVNTGWDNTPRYAERGYVIKNSTPKNYAKNLSNGLLNAKKYNSKLFYIACWNEWCEGMVLEPSNLFNHQYLEITKERINEIFK